VPVPCDTGTWYRHAACTKPVPLEQGKDKRVLSSVPGRDHTYTLETCPCFRDRLYTHDTFCPRLEQVFGFWFCNHVSAGIPPRHGGCGSHELCEEVCSCVYDINEPETCLGLRLVWACAVCVRRSACGSVEWTGKPSICRTLARANARSHLVAKVRKVHGPVHARQVNRAGSMLPLRQPEWRAWAREASKLLWARQDGAEPNGTSRRGLSRNLLASTLRSRADRQKMGQAMIDLICKDGRLLDHLCTGKSTKFRAHWAPYVHQRGVGPSVPTTCPCLTTSRTWTVTRGRRCILFLKKKCWHLATSWWHLTSRWHQAASTTQRSARLSCSGRNGSRLPTRLLETERSPLYPTDTRQS